MTETGRHAVLILAHTQPQLLRLLVGALDSPHIDVFVHMDEASPLQGHHLSCRHSALHVMRGRAAWAGFSLVTAEFRLLEAALRADSYDYLHLISGQDLPLVTPADLRERLAGRHEQFIGRTPARDGDADWKVRYWHPFADSRRYRTSVVLKGTRRAAVAAQRMMHVDRLSPMNLQPRHGSQWFSITAAFARWLLDRRQWAQRAFQYAITSDELLLPTMWATLHPPFELSSERDQNLRWINWDPVREPGPRTITMADVPEVTRQRQWCLFARKFDLITDPDAVAAVTQRLSG